MSKHIGSTAKTIGSKKQNRVNEAAKVGDFKNSAFGLKTFVRPEDLYRELTYSELKYSAYTYVPFALAGGCEDLYDNLFSALMTSPVNQGIIKKKVSWLIGEKFYLLPKNTRFGTNTTMPNVQQETALGEWMDKQNAEGENIDDLYRKIAFDFTTFGNAYVEFARTSEGSTKAFTQRVIPFADGRVGRLKDEEVEPTVLGISKYWIDGYTVNPPDLRTVAIYPLWSMDEDGVERSIYHIKNYSPGFTYYGCPDYIAGLIAAKNDYQIGKYNNTRFDNGFAPSALMTFYGDYTPEEAQKFLGDLEDVYTGAGSNSHIFATVLADKTNAPDINILDDKRDGAFMELSHLTSQSLVSAHRFTMSLAGFSTGGSLGSNQQIRAEFEYVFGDVIRPVQQELLRWVNLSVSLCENWTTQIFNANVAIKNLSPISYVNDIPPSQVLTIDEQRELLGYQPLQTTPQNG